MDPVISPNREQNAVDNGNCKSKADDLTNREKNINSDVGIDDDKNVPNSSNISYLEDTFLSSI